MTPQFLTTSRKLARHPDLATFLGSTVGYVSCQQSSFAEPAQGVLAWGRKPSAIKAEALAARLNLPVVRLEDGFIHSLGQGVLGAASCSLVRDHSGIYYDATCSSDLEKLLENDEQGQLDDLELLERAQLLIKKIVTQRISKYNNAPLSNDHMQLPKGKIVLLADQTAGDMSLKYGLVGAETAKIMLQAALAEHPDATVLIKTHPDVIAGKKRGCLPLENLPERVQVLSGALNPLAILEQVDHVYVMTSQLGFEALLMEKPVTCFGMPFYAGWGVTDDRVVEEYSGYQLRRTRKRSVPELFAAAYLLYSSYVHPDDGKLCELEAIVDYFVLQNHMFQENAGSLFAFGFSYWKRNYIRRFLYAPDNQLLFVGSAKQAKRKGFGADIGQNLVSWGERATQEIAGLGQPDTGISAWRIEDGFIRSAGLGSDYTPPLSLVLDKQGIYYDPQRPSDLENLLQHTVFSEELVERAANLRTTLLAHAISKYNLGGRLSREQLNTTLGQRIILVPGQVEDDASIWKGCVLQRTNGELLRAVRVACPEAFIIYKPHPDVVSGNRRGRVEPVLLKECCDLMLDDVSITDCLEMADEVHTLTSLVGFEALLRTKKVVCYGLPFYAGWGLTEDLHDTGRRGRQLQLDELVAATLILYPRYINWNTGAFTTPEYAVELLRHQIEQQGGKKKNKVFVLKRLLDKLVHIYHGVFTFRY